VGAGYVNYAHAEQIKAAKAEAALAAKIKSKDFKKIRTALGLVSGYENRHHPFFRPHL
jgi:hypothetical protein